MAHLWVPITPTRYPILSYLSIPSECLSPFPFIILSSVKIRYIGLSKSWKLGIDFTKLFLPSKKLLVHRIWQKNRRSISPTNLKAKVKSKFAKRHLLFAKYCFCLCKKFGQKTLMKLTIEHWIVKFSFLHVIKWVMQFYMPSFIRYC